MVGYGDSNFEERERDGLVTLNNKEKDTKPKEDTRFT